MLSMKNTGTRERLLEVAMNLIWTESYGSVGVDEICRKAGAQKGSFYHFFSAKVDLAVAALETAWQAYHPEVDRIFSSDKEPLRRLLDYLDLSIRKQQELRRKFGFYPGCPFTSIGIEQGARQEILRKTAEKHLNFVKRYFEKMLTEAVRMNHISIASPAAKADELFSLYLGAFARLRISNDLRVMKSMKVSILALLNVSQSGRRPKRPAVKKLAAMQAA